ncbi:MAG TPA: hypothetical protein VM942_08715 [Acidimicrobiales bacterium]|nr:hypothetical protein [Acidimicrobiales bacterium]
MERYVLFDSGCLVCSGMAHDIEHAAGGWLSVRSLRSAEVQRHLDRAAPGWKWEPMLLELDADDVRVHRGLPMRLRIAAGVGPRRAWAIAKLVQQAGEALADDASGRRGFLKGSAGVMAGVVLGLAAGPASARETVEDEPVPLGAATLVGGARAEELAAQALASRDVANLLKEHAVEGKEATVYEYATGTRHTDWSATFPAVGGGVITYMVRPAAEIRTQAIYERDNTFVALSVDGILSRTANYRLGQSGPKDAQITMNSCTESGCGFEYVNLCKRCCSTCSSYRSTDNTCCVCRTPGGGSYVFMCRAYAYGPCGMC